MHTRIRTTSFVGLAGLAAVGLAFVASPSTVEAGPPSSAMLGPRSYELTVTNLTRAQIFSPPIAAAHTDAVDMFEAGTPASAELAALAENGDNSLMAALLASTNEVRSWSAGPGMLHPGDSVTLPLTVDFNARYVSVAGMLVSTNDAFFGLDALTCPFEKDEIVLYVPAYDAGTEFNSEDCAYVPGPPCGAGPVHDAVNPPEGKVYISNGIQGIGGVTKATYDWRNPVARIVLRRL